MTDQLPTGGFSQKGAFEGDWIAMSILLLMVFAMLIWMGTSGGPLVGCVTCQGNVAKFFSSGNTSTSWMIYLVVPIAVASFVRNLLDRVAAEDESGVGELLRELDKVAPRQSLKEGLNVFRFQGVRAGVKAQEEQNVGRSAERERKRSLREAERIRQLEGIAEFRQGIEEGRGEGAEFEARGRLAAREYALRLEGERARLAAARLAPTDISQLGSSLAPNPVLTRAEVANLRRRGMTDSEIAAMQGIAVRRFEERAGRRLQGSLIVPGHRTAAGAIVPPVGSLRGRNARASRRAIVQAVGKISKSQAQGVNKSMNARNRAFLKNKKRVATQ